MIITFLEISYSPGGKHILHPSSPFLGEKNLRNMAADSMSLPFLTASLAASADL